MRNTIFCALALLTMSCTTPVDDFKPETIIALERAALDRWNNGDPNGYLETYAPEVTYFDPAIEKRIDGVEAMRKYLAPLTGKIHSDRYEMRNISVQRYGDVAALSYNLYTFGATFGGQPVSPNRPWNSTKIYARVNAQGRDQWKIVHDHWSFIQPELK